MPPRFCSTCGARLEPRDIGGRERCWCPACRVVVWENPVPAAAVVVRRPGEVLLCRRAIEPYAGSWTLPAGYQEVDETTETTAVREVREETGLVVRLTGLLDVLTTDDDPRKAAILVVYEAVEVDGELLPGDDAQEAAFHRLDALPEPLGFRNHRLVLDRLRRGVSRTW
ncbi:MAG: NUDIX hydrolase [Planctomycetes bacterium]|nr:NUDIX hydrolase [Planctomycetota bacterium]